ncbi:Entericidin EcnA/B family protein [Mesorhizobium australicum]|uniref:Entericidin EcnA/B family protein n=1 Tax=Mesorhizobium australicum TaxID=536018 RepID=A0A1X7PEY9_9HYPH|nr:Entericidin EcnA/B family protein [Mesorhizobium australicum]
MNAMMRVSMLVLIFAVGLSACANTVRGVGRDVRETAEAVEDSVD